MVGVPAAVRRTAAVPMGGPDGPPAAGSSQRTCDYAGETLSGLYLSTDASPSDTENRLFVNPAEAIPKGITSIRFERGAIQPPPPPVPISTVEGHVYYYRYRPGGVWEWWEPTELLARWRRVPRLLPDDGAAARYGWQ